LDYGTLDWDTSMVHPRAILSYFTPSCLVIRSARYVVIFFIHEYMVVLCV
jgi:hypothetical protein